MVPRYLIPNPEAVGAATLPKNFRRVATGDTNLAVIKNAAGRVYGLVLVNKAAAVKFVKLYNKATNADLATDTPVLTVLVPAGQTVQLDFDLGLAFSAGIALAMTGAATDTDTTALTAGDVILHAQYV